MQMYSPLTRVRATDLLFLAGMAATEADGSVIAANSFEQQCDCVYAKIRATLESAGANMDNIVQFTTYLTDAADIPRFMEYRRREFPRLFPSGRFPPNTLVVVQQFVRKELRIEIQSIAAV